MAKLSRNARHKARQKRTISLAYRQLRGLQADLARTHVTLLAAIAQAGGELTIKTETLIGMQTKWAQLGWALDAKPTEDGAAFAAEWVLRLVTQGE